MSVKRIWTYIIGALLFLIAAGSVFLAYSVIVAPSGGDVSGENSDVPEYAAQDQKRTEDEQISPDAENENVQHLARETVYVEKSTGMTFPGQVGVFVKTRVRENLNPVYGVTVSYQTPDSPCADIYIYSLDPAGTPVKKDAFSQTCAQVHGNILNMQQNGTVIDSVREIASAEKYPAEVYAKWYEVAVKEETIQSHLLMFLRGGKIIKIRVSFPADESGDLNDALLFERTILNAFFTAAAEEK